MHHALLVGVAKRVGNLDRDPQGVLDEIDGFLKQHGVFESYGTAKSVTKAGFLGKKGTKTDVFTRFSTVLGSRGSADTVRDTRGFAVKFYTEEGTFDLVGNNMPVFFIQDGIKFPDIIHAAKPQSGAARRRSRNTLPENAARPSSSSCGGGRPAAISVAAHRHAARR